MALGVRRRRSGRRGNGFRAASGPIAGPVRLGRKTKDLVKHLDEEDVAIIDHADIDRVAAEDLVATGVRVVVNCKPSSTGRYPNAGPLIIAESGARLVDLTDVDLFERLSDGDVVSVDEEGSIRHDGELIGAGVVQTVPILTEQHADQRERIGEALLAFAQNTAAHIQEEAEVLAGEIEFPETRTRFSDRHVLIVARATNYKKDLRALRAYLQDVRPLIIGVDGGADAVLEEGMRPDVILGDMDSASDRALRCGAELIVHAYPDGRAPGRARCEDLGLEPVVIPAAGTSQDIAMLLAFERGAKLIVTVGAQFNLIEFLDKNRSGMSSTFLTRLRIGEVLVDAKGVSRLYQPSVSGFHFAMFIAVLTLLLAVVVISSPALANLAELIWLKIKVWLNL